MLRLKRVYYNEGRRLCTVELWETRTPGPIRRFFGIRPSDTLVEVWTSDYGKTWMSDRGVRYFDEADGECLAFARSLYTWLPKGCLP